MNQQKSQLQFGKYLTKNIRRQAEQIEDVPLVPGVNRTQHLGYVSCTCALLYPTAIVLQLESTPKPKIKLYVYN